MNVYHMDWVAGALSFAGMYLVGRKKWYGWVVCIVNNFILVYLNVHFQLWGFLPVCAANFVLFVKNCWQWKVGNDNCKPGI